MLVDNLTVFFFGRRHYDLEISLVRITAIADEIKHLVITILIQKTVILNYNPTRTVYILMEVIRGALFETTEITNEKNEINLKLAPHHQDMVLGCWFIKEKKVGICKPMGRLKIETFLCTRLF